MTQLTRRTAVTGTGVAGPALVAPTGVAYAPVVRP